MQDNGRERNRKGKQKRAFGLIEEKETNKKENILQIDQQTNLAHINFEKSDAEFFLERWVYSFRFRRCSASTASTAITPNANETTIPPAHFVYRCMDFYATLTSACGKDVYIQLTNSFQCVCCLGLPIFTILQVIYQN